MAQDALLVMENIHKSFSMVKALTDARLELKHGEVHALMGENGAGKSTLMNILSGSLKADQGRIVYMGKEILIASPHEARLLGIGKIHQELQLVPELSVGENVFLGREPRTKFGLVDYNTLFSETKKVISKLNLAVSPKMKVKELRVGEQQLIEIAKAISLDSKILIMDEPTSALSKAESKRLFQVMEALKADGVTIVYITHRMEEVFEISDRITVMRDGAYVDTVNTSDTTKDSLIRMMVGREVRETQKNTFASIGEEILRTKNLSLSFPRFYKKASLKQINFSLCRGEILEIAGLMGAGRSELMETLSGLHPKAMSGEIFVGEKKVDIRSPQDAIRHKIAFLTEDRKSQGLVLTRSIGENLSLPIIRRLSPI